MDRRFSIVLTVSLLFALVVSSVLYILVGSPAPEKNHVDQAELKDLVVAVKEIPAGVLVGPAYVKIVKKRVDDYPKMGFAKVEEVLDRPVNSRILPDEPVLDARLGERGQTGIDVNIPPGMRAVTVRVNDVIGVAGFVQPGMHVDLLVTGRLPGQDGHSKTVTALQNLVVWRAGTVTHPDARGQAISVPNVTLLATPEQAELITLASNEGRIQFVIRSVQDNLATTTPGRSIDELFRVTPRPQPRPTPSRHKAEPVLVSKVPPPPPPPPSVEQITVIRGNQKSVETVSAQTDN